MKRVILSLLLTATGVFLFAPPGGAVVEEVIERRFDTHKWVGLGGLSFLKVGQGARPVAMGDAYTAVADDINAIFWNPAGLTAVRGTAWTGSYTKWLVDSYFFSGAVARNTGSSKGGVIGLSVVAFQTGDIPETTIFQPQGTGQNVSAGDMAIGGVYAVKLTDKFSFATRVSWVNQKLHTKNLRTVSVDLGTMFYTGFKSLRLAMAMKNFGPDKRVTDTKFFMPLYYNVAAAAEFYGEKGGPAYLTVAGETAFAADYDLRAHAGAELWLKNVFALRAGYKFNYDTDSFSVGAGLKVEVAKERAVTVDISYSDMGKFFSAPLRLTIGGAF